MVSFGNENGGYGFVDCDRDLEDVSLHRDGSGGADLDEVEEVEVETTDIVPGAPTPRRVSG